MVYEVAAVSLGADAKVVVIILWHDDGARMLDSVITTTYLL